MENKDIIRQLLKKLEDTAAKRIFADGEFERLLEVKEKKYPRFELSLSTNDIEKMKEEKILNDDNIINHKIFTDKNRTNLETLLLSILWKNGDYKKEAHIIRGVLYENGDKESSRNDKSFVFWNFGRYVANKERPIADQHTLRAYKAIRNQTGKTNSEVYEDYIKWFEEIINQFAESDRRDASYYLDSILFEYGKKINPKKLEK